MPGTLNSSSINASNVEKSTLDLWQEFLSGYFNGGTYGLNGSQKTWPLCKLTFQQGNLPQPLEGSAIQLNWTPTIRAKRRLHSPGNRMAYMKTQFTFYIRSATQNTGAGGSRTAVKEVSDLFYGLLSNRDLTLPLSRKGIRHIEVFPNRSMPSTDFSMRSIVVSAELQYGSEGARVETVGITVPILWNVEASTSLVVVGISRDILWNVLTPVGVSAEILWDVEEATQVLGTEGGEQLGTEGGDLIAP